MPIVIRLGELAGIPDGPPPGDDLDGIEMLPSDDPAALSRLWSVVLLFAVRDNAASVHYHPWRADGGLSSVVANVRYVMVPLPPELAGPFVAAARSLFTRPARGGWLGLGAGGGPACGTVELDVWGNPFVWDAVVWSSGERSGVDLFRIAPIIAEPNYTEQDAADQPGDGGGSGSLLPPP
jgi:hypothetical protein